MVDLDGPVREVVADEFEVLGAWAGDVTESFGSGGAAAVADDD